ncbi:MAG TPA: GH92 family glycosyl hydrolase [Mucilaginibacter sp.]|nr:GH92 family glycosyl hydrolase [Mucilaginibacter sp.]
MKKLSILVAFFLITFNIYGQQAKKPVDYVDPFIGSQGARWFAFTPAAMPFGLVKLAPMTYGFNGYFGGGGKSGYDNRQTSILGFAHVHEWQTGGILVMPTTGKLITVPGDDKTPGPGFRSSFNKANEKAAPGYYSVILDKYNIRAEITSTMRVGVHKYTFPQSDSAHIIFDTGHLLGEAGSYGWGGPESKEILGAGIEILSPTQLQGYTFAVPAYQTYKPGLEKKSIRVFFAATLSKPASSFGCYRDTTHNNNLKAEYGKGCGAYLNFKTKNNEAIEVRVAISFVSQEQAWENLKAEYHGESFDQVHEAAKTEWNKQLSKIEVEGGTEQNKVKFYTALYQVLLGRGICSDANGKYISNNNEIRQIPMKNGMPEYNHYINDALWGGYTNFIQIWSMAYPEQSNSYIKCMLDVYDETGWLPDGLTCDKFMPGMESNQMSIMIANAVNRGIATFDLQKAYQACYKNETEWVGRPQGVGKPDTKYFWQMGYIPINVSPRNAGSHTLESSYSSWAAAQIAKKLGKTADYEKLMKASHNWENIYDPQYGYFYPRNADGTFARPFSQASSRGLEEGTTMQYAFNVPHDIPGLANKMGKKRMVNLLDSMLTVAEKTKFRSPAYSHGNEPPLINPYVFNYVGKPELTQKWVRAIMDNYYDTTANGYKGADDDQGQLSGWFVLASMGLFDISGGCATDQQLYIHAPLFPKITIHLNKDYYKADTFTITTNHFSDKSIYVKSAKLNGVNLKELHFDYNKLNANTSLVLDLADVAK